MDVKAKDEAYGVQTSATGMATLDGLVFAGEAAKVNALRASLNSKISVNHDGTAAKSELVQINGDIFTEQLTTDGKVTDTSEISLGLGNDKSYWRGLGA